MNVNFKKLKKLNKVKNQKVANHYFRILKIGSFITLFAIAFSSMAMASSNLEIRKYSPNPLITHSIWMIVVSVIVTALILASFRNKGKAKRDEVY